MADLVLEEKSQVTAKRGFDDGFCFTAAVLYLYPGPLDVYPALIGRYMLGIIAVHARENGCQAFIVYIFDLMILDDIFTILLLIIGTGFFGPDNGCIIIMPLQQRALSLLFPGQVGDQAKDRLRVIHIHGRIGF